MPKSTRKKYRIPSARLPNWDYGSNASYFITICTGKMKCYFGDIVEGKMILSKLGEIAKSEWLRTLEIRPDMNLELDEFQVMPNHFHGIIHIGQNKFNCTDAMPGVSSHTSTKPGTDAMPGVSNPASSKDATPAIYPFEPTNITKPNKYGPQRKNLSSIIRGYKSAVTTESRKQDPTFRWQPRFHDHIIRDAQSLRNIRQYIRNNPANWLNAEQNHKSLKKNIK
ncbi:MAG: hypothetical protein JW801_08170 [Bacteroidales bacterium]|nr:hypothetical protein [Bacteroidales bacterium]